MKVFVFIAIALSIVFNVNHGLAASYTIKSGDSLSVVAQKLGHTTEQMLAMNEQIKNPNLIYAGKKLTYISARDIKNAKAWCKKRIEETARVGDWRHYHHFAYVHNDLCLKKFRYSINEPSGTHFSSVFVYAEAYRKIKVFSARGQYSWAKARYFPAYESIIEARF